jgi:hypothetical protein
MNAELARENRVLEEVLAARGARPGALLAGVRDANTHAEEAGVGGYPPLPGGARPRVVITAHADMLWNAHHKGIPRLQGVRVTADGPRLQSTRASPGPAGQGAPGPAPPASAAAASRTVPPSAAHSTRLSPDPSPALSSFLPRFEASRAPTRESARPAPALSGRAAVSAKGPAGWRSTTPPATTPPATPPDTGSDTRAAASGAWEGSRVFRDARDRDERGYVCDMCAICVRYVCDMFTMCVRCCVCDVCSI